MYSIKIGMIAEMQGWKVITQAIGNKRKSISYSSEYAIIYTINERVYPTLKDSMLFFFAKREDAVYLIGVNLDMIIVPGIAFDCQRIRLLNVDNIKFFWKNRKNKKGYLIED